MRALRLVSIVLASSFATVAMAGDFDGKVPLTCTALQAHDCLPTNPACAKLVPESKIEPIFGVDFAKKQVKSPYRNSTLKVQSTATRGDSLLMQGIDPDGVIAWSAIINRTSGSFTVTLGDSKGAYVAFGQCKVSAPAAPAKPAAKPAEKK